ncbi:MAG: hypothetical protein UR53_C0004G0009 [Candidatus Magasanikbacteria bacterium GW2011_GWC2_34_16]|uniref:Phosphoribosyltransferase n=2 Tax=Candidatus Magasanikiibacteriota TaxID=1752731 RepID=A0A0G0HAN6_9BACT|nr:MAG: hypothetical protein UR53_C0004G0009 [Candidatus Magasanikbacteria bacterium GW2011_GWC2_34_16]KKQ39187.1 MAG: hypothetical protein US58_C0039G0006 [Candidatus Magasanikbacteria bacterium GW2011_GWA2_37_8]
MSEKVIIADYSVDSDAMSLLTNLGLDILFPEEMTRRLILWEGWNNFNPNQTLLLFPGNGAEIVKRYLSVEWLARWPWQASVGISRFWRDGEAPQSIGGSLTRSYLGFKHVIVIDDVVSSGGTARQLRRLNEPWVPGAKWHVATWVAQYAAATKGFESVFATEWVGSKDRKIPINSLSTLVENRKIALSYINKNFPFEPAFNQMLERLRGDSNMSLCVTT